MSKITIWSLFLLFITYQNVISQNGLAKHHLHYVDFLIIKTIKVDTNLCQQIIDKDLDDGEYFIYYDKELTKLWMNGVVFDKRIEGKWEFRDRENRIFYYKVFSDGKSIPITLPENKFAKIYVPDKIYEFNAYYISASEDTVTNNTVVLKITSQVYEVQHNPRYNGEWRFHYKKKDSLALGTIYPWNDWEDSTLCLITENERKIEIYPPRRNQFVFTEIIDFPSISPANLQIGYQWNSQIQIPEDYELEEWSNTKFYHQSEITGKKTFHFQNDEIVCWVIRGNSSNKNFGTSHFEYLFNEEYGFVRLEWINYDNQKAVFELMNIKSN